MSQKSSIFAHEKHMMGEYKKIGVVIATSMNRIDSLFSLSLLSVLNQTVLPDCIVVVDDNNDPETGSGIEQRLQSIHSDCPIYYTKNQRTKNMSGTGSWNTGIDFLRKEIGEENYIAILDDDDSWDNTYIETLYSRLSDNPDAVFAYIKRSDTDYVSVFTKQDLTVEKFLVKDPGVQGSNMCFKIKRLVEIGGFDETLCATTDRDLMIRFLQRFGNENITVIEQKLVNYFASDNTVTSNFYIKRAGLNTFYRKHIRLFDWPVLLQSLQRAEKLFRFPDAEEIKSLFRQSNPGYTVEDQVIAIGVAMHNNASTVRRCLSSIVRQEHLKRKLKIVLADDNSSDNWQSGIADLLQDSRVTVLSLRNGNVVKTRNDINRYIMDNIPGCVLVGRLDADDEYSSPLELSKIENILDTYYPDVIAAGNYLRENGTVIERINRADKRLADSSYVLLRLKQMAECLQESELPSCNLFVQPHRLLPYPQMESGEDHALFVQYLLQQDKYNIFFAEDLLPVIYDLGGSATTKSKSSGNFIRCRKELYSKALELCKTKKEDGKR